jgi:hypothetical protein
MRWVARFPYSRFRDIEAPATAACALIKASGKSHFYITMIYTAIIQKSSKMRAR